MSSSVSLNNLFVYGALQESDISSLLLNRVPNTASAVLSGLYRLKDRIFPCVLASENGKVPGKVLLALTDDELKILDEFENVEYYRKTVEVELTDTSEKMQVETYIWANKDDPDIYGEWDFEEWKQKHKETFSSAVKKYVEDKKNPEAETKIYSLLDAAQRESGHT